MGFFKCIAAALLLAVVVPLMVPAPGLARGPEKEVLREDFNEDRADYAVIDDLKVYIPAPEPATWRLEGRVFEGEVGDESRPLQGVTIEAYVANSPYPETGKLLTSTTTDEKGWYGLEVPDGYEFYSIRETDPPGYESVGATSAGGTVRTSNWIEYALPLERKTLTGNRFWDKPIKPAVAEGPDLAIASAYDWHFEEENRLLVLPVKIVNRGNMAAGDTVVQAFDPDYGWSSRKTRIPSLAPEGQITVDVVLEIPDEMRGMKHTFLVEIDPEDVVRELNEDNNRTTTPTIFIPPPERPDLVVDSLEWEIVDDRLLVITAWVENTGDAGSPETALHVESRTARWWSAEATVPELGSRRGTRITVELEIPEEMHGQVHLFRAQVDPRGELVEQNEDNNWHDIEIEIMVPETAEEGEDRTALLVITVVVGAIAVISITLTVRHSISVRRHREWQEKSKEEEPPETCQECTYYCRKIEIELKPALRKIAHLNITARDTGSGEQIKEMRVQGEIVDRLNGVVAARRRGVKPEKLQEQISPLASTLMQQIIEWLRGEESSRDISIAGHLQGGKVTCQFILYHCKRRGTTNVWEEEDKWKATLEEKRDEPVGLLHALYSAEPNTAERLKPELVRFLTQFIEKV